MSGARRALASFPTEVVTAGIRPALLAGSLIAAVGFVLDTLAAVSHPYFEFDLAVERAVQQTGWGPFQATFAAFGALSGLRQVAAALAAILLVAVFNRGAVPLMAAGALTGGLYQGVSLLIHRPRPLDSLVRVAQPLPCCGYPSGHANFFLTFVTLLVLSLGRPYLPRAARPALYALGGLVVADACVSRMYVGAHWPSDVIGGLLLGTSWTLLVLSLRRLSDPVLGDRPEQPR